MFRKFTCFFLLITFISTFNCAFAKEKAPKINTLDYINLPYWKNYNDTNLTDYMLEIYKNNNDLKATSYRIKETQRIVKISLANELPHIAFDGYVGQVFNSSDEVFGDITIPNYSETHYLLPLTMNYEIDIWGKNHLKTKSQKKQLEMLEQDERAVYIALTSDFAANYFNLIKVDKLISLQKDLIKTQEDVVKSVQLKKQAGTATVNDEIYTQKSLTYMKEDLNNMLEKQDVLQNQICVFLGDRDFPQIKRKDFEKVNVKVQIPSGIDTDSLSDRPDWVKSELQLQKIGLDVRIAKRELLPKFILNGNLGFNAYSISSSNTFLANLGVVPYWDLFDGGRKYNILKLQKFKYKEYLEEYNKTILTSIQETNDALYSLKSTDKNYKIASDRLNLDKKEMNLLNKKTQIGMADKLDLLLKKEQVIDSEKKNVSLKINEIISEINLYKALGGKDYNKSL